ncbi:MAG: WXG100 family type VII secretion target [Sporichthyaceae bacterium]
MSTVSVVRAWCTDELHESAAGLSRAAAGLDDQVNALRKATDRALESWRGVSADAAADRLHRERADGLALFDALAVMAKHIAQGAVALGNARAELCVLVDAAISQGYLVAEDGTVTPPPKMGPAPVSTSLTWNAAGELANRQADLEHQRTEAECAADAVGAGIARALLVVMETDYLLAAALRRVELPRSMQAQVGAMIASAGSGYGATDWLTGGYHTGRAIYDGDEFRDKASDFRRLLRGGDESVARRFAHGPSDGGGLRFLMGARAARVVGHSFLPLTMLSGGMDAIDGGGYSGVRGDVTTVLGGSASISAAAILAGGTPFLASNPVGWTIAGGIVLAYTGWSLGNLVYDHHEAIGDFLAVSGQGIVDGAQATVEVAADAVADSVEWAGDQLGRWLP